MGKLLFVSSTPSLLQFIFADLPRVMAVSKGTFDSLYLRARLHPFLHTLSSCWFVTDLVVEGKMTLNISWSP